MNSLSIRLLGSGRISFLYYPVEAKMAIQFKLNKQKAIEAVLWLIQRGESDMYRI